MAPRARPFALQIGKQQVRTGRLPPTPRQVRGSRRMSSFHQTGGATREDGGVPSGGLSPQSPSADPGKCPPVARSTTTRHRISRGCRAEDFFVCADQSRPRARLRNQCPGDDEAPRAGALVSVQRLRPVAVCLNSSRMGLQASDDGERPTLARSLGSRWAAMSRSWLLPDVRCKSVVL